MLCQQVAGPTPSPPASTMLMVADLPALERVETHQPVSLSVNLDTHQATKRTSIMVKKKGKHFDHHSQGRHGRDLGLSMLTLTLSL